MALTRRHLLTALPVIGVAACGAGFWEMLKGMQTGRFDPHAVDTPIIGHDLPEFPSLQGISGLREGFSPETLRTQTKPVLINFMASWCVPCVLEMPFLKTVSSDITIWGIVYKDKENRASAFIQRNGTPYERIGQDPDGKAAIEWGVTGVPESFLVMPGGKIVWHGSAALNKTTFQHTVRPLLDRTVESKG